MDKILRKLIDNENHAKNNLKRCEGDIEFVLNLQVLKDATSVLNAYISYKKAEESYKKAENETEKYYKIINDININN